MIACCADGDHQSDRLLAVERGLNASGLRSRYPSAMHAMHIYQILNHYTSRQELDPGFRVLDNSTNERPDWFEYWPIRKFLLNQKLDENAFYGFLSPKFKHKTNLNAALVRDAILATDAATEVVLFSPSIHNSAYFLSVF